MDKDKLQSVIQNYNKIHAELENINVLFAKYKQEYIAEFQNDMNEMEQVRLDKQEKMQQSNTENNEVKIHGNVNIDLQETGNNDQHVNDKSTFKDTCENEEIKLPPKSTNTSLKRLITELYDGLCFVYHPDRNSGNEETFLKLQKEYEEDNLAALIFLSLTTKDVSIEKYIKDQEVPVVINTIEHQTHIDAKLINDAKSNVIWVWGNANLEEKAALKKRILEMMNV